MAELTQEQQLQIRTDLSRTTGITVGDPFTSAADSRALVAWLAMDGMRWIDFYHALAPHLSIPLLQIGSKESPQFTNQSFVALAVMTIPLPVIALAAHRSLGFEVTK